MRAPRGTRAVAALGLTASLALAGCGAAARTPAPGAAARLAASPSFPAGTTLVAMLDHAVTRFRAPGGSADGSVPSSWFGARSVLPVIATRPGWLEVRLAQRPDGSTAWVRSTAVRLRWTPYRIVINLATTHLTLLDRGRVVMFVPAGVGTVTDPTPTGEYFVAFFAQPPTPAYGAFVIVTSDHSKSITDWERSGDAMIAIHGPLGGDALIGTAGARISHGCVRLHESDLLRLRTVPAGSPVDIVG